MDSFSPQDTICLQQFKYAYPLGDPNYYNYDIRYNQLINPFDSELFYINKTTDCLSIKFNNGIDKNSLVGMHLLNISITDIYNQRDSLSCSIYITQSCELISYVYVGFNEQQVSSNLNSYVLWVALLVASFKYAYLIIIFFVLFSYLSSFLSNLLCQNVYTVVHAIYASQIDYKQDMKIYG